MGAKYSFYMKSIETNARAFLALIILGIGTVLGERVFGENFPPCSGAEIRSSGIKLSCGGSGGHQFSQIDSRESKSTTWFICRNDLTSFLETDPGCKQRLAPASQTL